MGKPNKKESVSEEEAFESLGLGDMLSDEKAFGDLGVEIKGTVEEEKAEEYQEPAIKKVIDTDKSAWNDSQDEALLNNFLFQVQITLKSGDITPKELDDLMSVTEKVMRRKRINQKGYDAVPANELKRIEEQKREKEKEEEKFPVANLHPGQKVDNL